MHKSYKKTIAILMTCVLISALLVLPVSAATQYRDVTYNHCRFYDLFFHTYDANGNMLADSGAAEDVALAFQNPNNDSYYVGDGAGTLACVIFSGDTFGGTSSYYRTIGWKVELPYTDNRQNFSMKIKLRANSGVDTDISLGLNTKVTCNGQDAYITRAADGDNLYVEFNNIKGGSTVNFQIASLLYNDWISMYLDFSDIDVQSISNSQIEKEEAQGSGNSAADDVTNVLPNESEGFMNAMQSFVGAMSTTDTSCSITFPGIKVPALEGFFPETELLGETDVDFSQAIGLIPENVMKLIRALTTVALIVFCFKELYDTISEALTRRQQNE